MVDFENIDSTISLFRTGKFGIKISKKARTDWCQFEYRGIEWINNGVIHLLEIFPELKDDCTYEKWNFTAISFYDEGGRRYSSKEKILDRVSFDRLNQNFEMTFLNACSSLNKISKDELKE